jgi:hypothetical protein
MSSVASDSPATSLLCSREAATARASSSSSSSMVVLPKIQTTHIVSIILSASVPWQGKKCVQGNQMITGYQLIT